MAERRLPVDEIAQHLRIKKDTIYKRIRKRNMPAHKAGRLLKFQVREIEQWIREGKASSVCGK